MGTEGFRKLAEDFQGAEKAYTWANELQDVAQKWRERGSRYGSEHYVKMIILYGKTLGFTEAMCRLGAIRAERYNDLVNELIELIEEKRE